MYYQLCKYQFKPVKKLKIKKFYFIIILLISIYSCKEDDLLPPLTQSGEGMLACFINGDAWIARTVQGISEKHIEASYFQNSDLLIITSRRITSDINETIEFTIYNIESEGSYTIGFNAKGEGMFMEIKPAEQIVYRTSIERGGKADIKFLDFNNKIVSGEFEFNTVDAYGNEKDITEGRFDVKFEIYN